MFAIPFYSGQWLFLKPLNGAWVGVEGGADKIQDWTVHNESTW